MQGAVEVAVSYFNDAEIAGGVDQHRIDAESVLVKFAGLGGGSAALFDVGKSVEQCGIVGSLHDGLAQIALGFGAGAGVSGLRKGFPGQGEVAHILRIRGDDGGMAGFTGVVASEFGLRCRLRCLRSDA